MTIAYFHDCESAALEHHGLDLVRDMIHRLSLGGLRLPRRGPIPEGPHFVYLPNQPLFFGRQGRGPLEIALDTNLLIDYFQHGRALWAGDALPDIVADDHGEQLEALQLIVALWVVRDIRFRILSGFLDDSKKKLHPDRVQQRRGAWHEFRSAISLVADDGDFTGNPLSLPRSVLEAALAKVPAGKDRELIAEGVRRRVHVFATRDKGILAASRAFRPLGLHIVTPQDLLGDLADCGALDCLVDPWYLRWPLPDQQRVAHLIRALPTSQRPLSRPRMNR